MSQLETSARAALMDLAEKVSKMRDDLVPGNESYWHGHSDGQKAAFDLVLKTIVAELDRK